MEREGGNLQEMTVRRANQVQEGLQVRLRNQTVLQGGDNMLIAQTRERRSRAVKGTLP